MNLNFENILCIRKDLIVMRFVPPALDLHFGWIKQGKEASRNMRFTFAIVGGGLTATAMLHQFVNRVQALADTGQLNPTKIGIQVYERQDTFGPGFAHNARMTFPFHITNMCASDMGILAGHPADFDDWVVRNSARLQKRFSYFRDSLVELSGSRLNCNHYPRAIMGEYLKTRFQETVTSARTAGLDLSLYPSTEVIDLKFHQNKIRLQVKDLSSGTRHFREADRVLLATGHWSEQNAGTCYFASPWPARKLQRTIPPGVNVAIIGTSLSATETLLTLSADGKFVRSSSGNLSYKPPTNPRRFCLYSRRGLLPKVRGKMGSRKNRVLTRENLSRLLSENRGPLTLDKIFHLLDSELEAAYGHSIDWQEILYPEGKPADLLQGYLEDAVNGDGPDGELIWQTVLHQSFDMVRDVYLNLKLDERRRFDQNLTSVFFTHAATQPAINAEKLLALMRAGLVNVIKLGSAYQLAKNENNDYYEFIYRDTRGIERRDAYRYVVNARGQNRDLRTDPSELAINLLKRGIVQVSEYRLDSNSTASPGGKASDLKPPEEINETGSIWIDPGTHRIMQATPGQMATPSDGIYAVGAMTRGQIIDASMARGIVQATSKITEDLVDYLIRSRKS